MSGGDRRAVYLLFAVPVIGTLLPWIYNRAEPRLFGIPFFYWYQLVWIPIAVTCTLIVYRATRSGQ